MKKITKLTLSTASLKIARIVFLADLLLMVPVVDAGETRTGDGIIVNRNVEKKESRMVNKLTSLDKGLIGQAFLIEQAIKDITDSSVKENLESYKKKTNEQVEKLARFIEKEGGKVPEYSRDIATFFGQTWEQIRGLISEKGELTALRNQVKGIFKEAEEALRDGDEKSKSTLQEVVDFTKELKGYLDKVVT